MSLPIGDPISCRHICPTEQVIELVANKWTVHILYRLDTHGVLRFRELQRAVGGVAQKELTKHLRRLERFGLVSRTVFPEVPVRVEYRLTEAGRSLLVPLRELSAWSERHGPALLAHRAAFDQAQGSALEAPSDREEASSSAT